MTRASGGSTLITTTAKYLGDSSSGKAFKASLYKPNTADEIIATIWLPHSQVKDGSGNKVVAEYGNEITILIPLWLAEKGRFDSYYKQQMLDEEYVR